jgi:tetratricopeptide (TPR) repeat protein
MSRLMLRSLIILFVLVFSAIPALAQVSRSDRGRLSGYISGQVRYAKGYKAAFNITVRCESFNGGLIGQDQTTRNGKFSFSGLRPDMYTITVHTPGYLDEQETVDLSTSPSGYVQISLRSDGSGLGEEAVAAPPAVINAKVPLDARKEYEKALSTVNDKDTIKEGISHLEKAVSLYREFLEAELLLGTAYMDTREWDKAEAALRRAIKISPKSAQPYFALGELFRQKKNYQEAEKVLQDGIKLEKLSWLGHLTLGRVYYDKGDMWKAGPEVGTALRLKPDLADARRLGGHILMRVNRLPDAIEQFEEYLRLEPKGKFADQTRDLVAKIKKAMVAVKK